MTALLERDPVLSDHDHDNGDDDEFHLEDPDRPGFALCGVPLDEDEPLRPMVRGLYDCAECWCLNDERDDDWDDYEEDEPHGCAFVCFALLAWWALVVLLVLAIIHV